MAVITDTFQHKSINDGVFKKFFNRLWANRIWRAGSFIIVFAAIGVGVMFLIHASPLITLVGTSKGGAYYGTTLNVGLPSGIQANDQIIVTVQAGSSTTLVTPPGWTEVSDYNGNAYSPTLYVFRKTAVGNEITFTTTKNASVGAWASVAVYRGVNPSTPIDKISEAYAGGNSVTAPAITTSVPSEELVLAEAADNNSTVGTWTAPKGFTQEVNSAVQWSSSGLADMNLSAAGSSGNVKASFNSAASLAVVLFSLEPAPTPRNNVTSQQITFIGKSNGGAYYGTSLSINLPNGIQANDQIIVTVQTGSSTILATPPGWTLDTNYLGGVYSPRIYVFNKTASGNETTFTTTKNISAGAWASVAVYRGVNPTTPIDQISTASGGGTTIQALAITASVPSEELVLAEAADNNSTVGTWTAPTGFTQEVNSAVQWSSSGLADMNLSAAGSSGSPAATFNSSAALAVVLLGIKPAISASTAVSLSTPVLSGIAASSSSVNLTWTASTSSVAITGYDIYRNNTLITNTPNTIYTDTGLTPGAAYNYYVVAYTTKGNVSTNSNQVSVTTQTASTAASNNISKLGVYAGPTNLTGINTVSTLLGQQVPWAMEFLDGTDWAHTTQNGWPYPSWEGTGYRMIWGIPILPSTYSPSSDINDTTGSVYGLSQGAAGDFNSYFVTVAQNMVNDGFANSIIRLGWEFNGGWFPWAANGGANYFIQYWQNIVNSMRSVTGQHFLFEWNPTLGDQGAGNLANYYPGNNYVDIIGEDVYDLNWNNYPGCEANWQNMLTETYGLNWFANFAAQQGKLMAFPEWGLGWGTTAVNCGTLSNTGGQTGGGDDAYFVQQMVNYINTHNFIEATVWDYGSSPLPNTTQYPNATAAFKSGF